MKVAVNKILLIIVLISIQPNTSCAPYTDSFAQIKLNGIRIWVAPFSTRIVLDVNAKPYYQLQVLHHPERIIIDLPNTTLNPKFIKHLNGKTNHGSIKKIETFTSSNAIKVILHLNNEVLANSFVLPPNERYSDRLVIDLDSTEEKDKILALFDLDYRNNSNNPTIKPLIIAIDPGHGGEDPGAIGPRGTLEKDIVLAIAKKLQYKINSSGNMRAFLTREGDYYISLQDRIRRARQNQADLLLSIHADAFSRPKADGASIFVLSAKGGSSAAAKWLAESQNKSDSIGGVKISDKRDILASVILDLSQTANSVASLQAAQSILAAMGKTIPLHKAIVEHANFAVLKAPDVPSVLIETGFISNPNTELKLKNPKYQHTIVDTVMHGIYAYFKSSPAANKLGGVK